jgi:glutamate/tyrosine decarboxylase-like PLP-dependent enzyme
MSNQSPDHKPLRTAFEHALTYLDHLDSQPVGASAGAEALRSQLFKPLLDDGMPAEVVVSELARDVAGGLHASAGGRFFGWVIGGSLPAALAADWLTSTWDQNAGLYAVAPAAAIVEEVVGEWLKVLLQLPPQASFALVTGTQMAHVTCLAAARHALLAKRGWDVEERGLAGAPVIRILASDQHHGSVDRAVRLLGLGASNLLDIATDVQGRVLSDALEEALAQDADAPTIIILQAGDVNTGAFDDFKQLTPLGKKYGAWTHVDGAFGLWAAASPRYRHLMEGASNADSWVTDGHKWLNVPYDCGFAMVTHPEAHSASMSHRASYLTHATKERDEMDWNPEFSRRARGFASYAALRQLGRTGVAGLVERCCAHAQSLVKGIGQLPGAQVLSEATINQALVRFRNPAPGATEQDHDRWTDQVIAAIAESGEAFFTGTTWRGHRAMRISVSSWKTSDADVERTIAAVARVLEEARIPVPSSTRR